MKTSKKKSPKGPKVLDKDVVKPEVDTLTELLEKAKDKAEALAAVVEDENKTYDPDKADAGPQTELDKAMDWVAHTLNMCQVEGHWTMKVSGWLMPYNGCGCCLAWRGLMVGFGLGLIFAGLTAVTGGVIYPYINP
jgi:hypothetical protein